MVVTAMIQAGKEAEKKRKQKYINNIFNQSTVNHSLHGATVNSYKPQNEQQTHAKNTAIEYVKTFSVDKPKSLILQARMVPEKPYSLCHSKGNKNEGYSVAFMHIPMLMERIKATYNKNATETTTNSLSYKQYRFACT